VALAKLSRRSARIYSHPAWIVLGVIASISSLISVPLAVYFYVRSHDYRQLIYYVHPVKAVLLKSDSTSKIRATFENKDVKTDITTAQLAIWNQGSESIKAVNVLKPVVIRTEDGSPILEATIRKTSRDVTGLQLTTDEISKGRLGVSWNILEYGDGAVLQIMYSGTPDVHFLVDGVIEGQEHVKQMSFGIKIQSPGEQFDEGRSSIKRLVFTVFALSIVLIFLAFQLLRWIRKTNRRTKETTVLMDYEEVDAIIAGNPDKINEFQELSKTRSVESGKTRPLVKVRNVFMMSVVILGSVIALIGIVVGVVALIVLHERTPFGF
jgi:hypothetical protein